MITDFDDFCLYAYVVIDTIVQSMQGVLQRPGPEPLCSDSELLTMSLIGECKGWDVETELLSNLNAYHSLFPHIPIHRRNKPFSAINCTCWSRWV
ncbi:MAG: IS982 family transposase, partial [Caldilineaceae bacterium]